MICDYEGEEPCKRPIKTLGLCGTHYQYLRRIGSPLLTAKRVARASVPLGVCVASDVTGKRCVTNALPASQYCSKHRVRTETHGDPRIARVRRVEGVLMTTVKAYDMRARASAGVPVGSLAREYGLSIDYVTELVGGRGWHEV